jgi:hypothetical protein
MVILYKQMRATEAHLHIYIIPRKEGYEQMAKKMPLTVRVQLGARHGVLNKSKGTNDCAPAEQEGTAGVDAAPTKLPSKSRRLGFSTSTLLL